MYVVIKTDVASDTYSYLQNSTRLRVRSKFLCLYALRSCLAKAMLLSSNIYAFGF